MCALCAQVTNTGKAFLHGTLILFYFYSPDNSNSGLHPPSQNCLDDVTGTTVIRMKDYIFVREDIIKKIAIYIAQKIDGQGIETSMNLN